MEIEEFRISVKSMEDLLSLRFYVKSIHENQKVLRVLFFAISGLVFKVGRFKSTRPRSTFRPKIDFFREMIFWVLSGKMTQNGHFDGKNKRYSPVWNTTQYYLIVVPKRSVFSALSHVEICILSPNLQKLCEISLFNTRIL